MQNVDLTKILILNLIPWKWDQQFKEPTESSDRKVDSKYRAHFASLFELTSPTTVMLWQRDQEKFFDLWNNSDIPDLLTVAPGCRRDQVVAEVVCLGDSNVNQRSLCISQKGSS